MAPLFARALLAVVPLTCGADDADAFSQGCTITAAACKNFPEYQKKQFRDSLVEDHLDGKNNDAQCLKRAEDFHHWCGNNAADGAQVAATHGPSEVTQIYHPGACDAGWSQWDAFCYKHYWEKRNWFDAERLCRERDSHLVSVHSRAENRFVYTLTHGLSAWIGYTDLDQDTHFQWSDNTQDDFSNFAKNCTGREEEPDCKPEEKVQQWYDWEGHDEGTFVCKRNALIPMSLLRNVTAAMMTLKRWDSLLPVLAMDATAHDKKNLTALPSVNDLELKTPEIPTSSTDDSTTKKSPAGRPAAPVLKAGVPKGSLL